MLAIIGGSGLAELSNLSVVRREALQTPHGMPSGALVFGAIARRDVVFIARHGTGSSIPPHDVNYRANVWALHAAGARDVVAIASVGGIRRDLAPGMLAVPDQILDYTHGRASTFPAPAGHRVRHIDFTQPYCETMRQALLQAAAGAKVPMVAGGTYAAMQGPRLETAAEIDRLERDGADMVGMTGMPEAALARELGLCYAAIAVVVNHAAGRGSSAAGISMEDIDRVARQAAAGVESILERAVASHGH